MCVCVCVRVCVVCGVCLCGMCVYVVCVMYLQMPKKVIWEWFLYQHIFAH